jgi:hypothetical protein
MSLRNVKIELKTHAIARMSERGGNFREAIEYLRRGTVVLTKNYQGYEISIPFMGRFAGDFDQGVFVIKTFCLPFRSNRDYYPNCEKTRTQQTVRITSIRLPGGMGYYA